jgi:TRAP-type mannitol/chloroaromatic compound transport system permease small subunit
MLRYLDRFVHTILEGAKWLALPVVLLLFLQWPLRSVAGPISREANDLGQWLFALYIAIAITAATRANTHLAADMLARRYPLGWRRLLARLGAALGLIPWALFVLITSKSIVISSVLALELFPDTFNPGYFIIKLALWLLALLILCEGILELFAPMRSGDA